MKRKKKPQDRLLLTNHEIIELSDATSTNLQQVMPLAPACRGKTQQNFGSNYTAKIVNDEFEITVTVEVQRLWRLGFR